jgi:hypothetical protein
MTVTSPSPPERRCRGADKGVAEYLDTLRNAGFQTIYAIDVAPELSGRITSVQVAAQKR